jgi:CrcB protein
MAQLEWYSKDLGFTEMIPAAQRHRQLRAQLTQLQLPLLPPPHHQPRLQNRHRPVRQAQLLKFGFVAALGAALGSLSRLQISYWVQTPSDTSFPWSTFLVNIIGALLIGLVASYPEIMHNETRRHFVVTGLLGGFTTFSALAVETLHMASTPLISISYVVATFGVGIAATHIGSLLGERR